MAEQAVRAQAGSDVRRYLTFRASGRLYALPAEEVREIVLPAGTARVPLSPPALLGLTNLRGVVLPVVSLRLMLAPGADMPSSPAQRVVVLERQPPVGLLVDEVSTLASVAGGQISVEEAQITSERAEAVRGAFDVNGSDEFAKILDIDAMLGKALGAVARPKTVVRAPATRERVSTVDAAPVDTFIVFEVAGQEFGLPLASVREVLPSAEVSTAMPRAESVVLGLTKLRDALLPLLSMRGLLGFSGDADRRMTLVASVGGASVGLAVDAVRDIVRSDRGALEPVPAAIASRSQGEAAIQSVLKVDGSRRLIAILSPDNLFRADVMSRIKASGVAAQTEAAPVVVNGTERIFLVFKLGQQEFGLAISAVEEVARLSEDVTRLPKSPDFLKGVINLRGVVLPIIDQRRRFDLPADDTAEGRRLVVARTGSNVAGFIVDGVSEVLRVQASQIEPAPDVVASNRMLEGVINLADAGRMILLLDPSQLLTRTEQGLLDALGRVQEAQSAVDQNPDR